MAMTSTTSGQLAASAAVAARAGRVHAIILTPASADATVILYDNPSAAAGNILAQVDAKSGAISESVALNVPVEANTGIYASLSGTGAKVIVHFSLL